MFALPIPVLPAWPTACHPAAPVTPWSPVLTVLERWTTQDQVTITGPDGTTQQMTLRRDHIRMQDDHGNRIVHMHQSVHQSVPPATSHQPPARPLWKHKNS